MNPFVQRLAEERFLPVAVLDDPDDAIPLVDALAAGGLRIVEITLRTAAGLPAIKRAAGREVLVGAGTVLTVDQVDRAVDAGAAFVVTPGFSSRVVEHCIRLGVPVLPGIATPGEVITALELGLDTVKLFPAAQLGGPEMVDALAGPFPDLRLVPSGGVDLARATDYLRRSAVIAVSGSWVTPRGPLKPSGVESAARVTLARLRATTVAS